MHNEGFGKKWIERILGKVDKDQGVANAGKVLGIGNDGQVVPVAQSGGSAFTPWTEELTKSEFARKFESGEIHTGDLVQVSVHYDTCTGNTSSYLEPISTNSSLKRAIINPTITTTSKSFIFTIFAIFDNSMYLTYFDEHLNTNKAIEVAISQGSSETTTIEVIEEIILKSIRIGPFGDLYGTKSVNLYALRSNEVIGELLYRGNETSFKEETPSYRITHMS